MPSQHTPVKKGGSNQISNEIINEISNKISNKISNQIINQICNEISNRISNRINSGDSVMGEVIGSRTYCCRCFHVFNGAQHPPIRSTFLAVRSVLCLERGFYDGGCILH